jgi:hypothetical protein
VSHSNNANKLSILYFFYNLYFIFTTHPNPVLTEIDISGCDSGLDTPPSTTHRPSSYRDVYFMSPGKRDSTDTVVSSSRGTLVSPRNSFRSNNNMGSIKTMSNNNSQQNSMSRSSVITKISNINGSRWVKSILYEKIE